MDALRIAYFLYRSDYFCLVPGVPLDGTQTDRPVATLQRHRLLLHPFGVLPRPSDLSVSTATFFNEIGTIVKYCT